MKPDEAMTVKNPSSETTTKAKKRTGVSMRLVSFVGIEHPF
jgi:hypothetical protein